MRVQTTVFATLRRHLPDLKLGEYLDVDLEPGATVASLRDRLGLPPEEVRIIFRNNVHAEPADELKDGDRVVFLPAVAGG
jgi:molybdopterin converting factor small subunit